MNTNAQHNKTETLETRMKASASSRDTPNRGATARFTDTTNREATKRLVDAQSGKVQRD